MNKSFVIQWLVILLLFVHTTVSGRIVRKFRVLTNLSEWVIRQGLRDAQFACFRLKLGLR